MCSGGNAVKEVEHQSEYMSQREHGNNAVAGFQPYLIINVNHVGKDAAIGEHYSLGIACCT